MTWTPEHPASTDAWEAVRGNLSDRDWGSRSIAVSIAAQAGGWTHERATDFVRSLIKNGYLIADAGRVKLS